MESFCDSRGGCSAAQRQVLWDTEDEAQVTFMQERGFPKIDGVKPPKWRRIFPTTPQLRVTEHGNSSEEMWGSVQSSLGAFFGGNPGESNVFLWDFLSFRAELLAKNIEQ